MNKEMDRNLNKNKMNKNERKTIQKHEKIFVV